MNILFYSASNNESSKRLGRVIELLVSETALATFHSVPALSRGLRQPADETAAVVLHASTTKDLSRLLSLKERLWDFRVILILPDSKETTLAMGHALHPRFLSFCDDDFVEVTAVLGRILGRNHSFHSRKEVMDHERL